MGLETPVPSRIEDLNTAWPLDGDDVDEGAGHLRGVKSAIAGSFPSLGSTAVTATAEEINELASKASNFVVSFGPSGSPRQGAVEPLDGDYSLDMLSDVDITTSTPSQYDLLGFLAGTTEAVPQAGPLVEHAHYHGVTALVGDRVRFSAAYYDTTDGVLGTVTNDGTDGYVFEATETILVNVSFSASWQAPFTSPETAAYISRNASGTSSPTGSEQLAFSTHDASSLINAAAPAVSASLIMTSGDTLSFYAELLSGTASIDDARMTLTAMRCVT